MGFFKNLFKKKKVEEKEIDPQYEKRDSPSFIGDCEYCKNPMFTYENTLKKGGNRYHCKCFKKAKKESKKLIYGGKAGNK